MKKIPLEIIAKHPDLITLLQQRGTASLLGAALVGEITFVKLLLQYGFDVNYKNEADGVTALHIAVDNNHRCIVELLLKNGAKADKERTDGYTPLHLAVLNNHTEIVQLLLNHSAKVDNKTSCGYTSLHLVVESRNTKMIKLLLQHGASQLFLLDLASIGEYSLVEWSLANGFDVNYADEVEGLTLLHIAVGNDNLVMVKLLLGKGANFATVTKRGHTPLHIAVFNEHAEIVKLLLQHGAKQNLLLAAVTNDNCDLVKWCLHNGFDVNYENEEGGETPLHIAVLKNHIEMVTLLLGKGANINKKMSCGETPLAIAISLNHAKIIELLQKNTAGQDSTVTLARDFSKLFSSPVTIDKKKGAVTDEKKGAATDDNAATDDAWQLVDYP